MKHLKHNLATNNSLIARGNSSLSLLVFALIVFTGCKKENFHPREIFVHKDSSIQAAVAAAVGATVIKIEPGTYNEAIKVNKPHITLVGLSDAKKGGVFIQNTGEEENGISVSENGDDFVLKNVTVSNFEENGVFLTGVDGFLLSHVTTINNGEYGLFPVHSTNGIIEECIATGHTDTGIYVGQSTDVSVNRNEAYANVNGIEIENCSNIIAEKNHSYNNVSGILVVLLPGLPVKESSNILLTKNKIDNNNHINFADPTAGFESAVPSGSGILIVGTNNTIVKENEVTGNNFTGIALVSTVILGSLAGLPPEAFKDIEPNPDGTKIINNKVINNGVAAPPELLLPGVDLLWVESGTNNCWSGNTFTSSYPAALPACL